MVCESCKEARSADHDVRSHALTLFDGDGEAKRPNPHVVSRRRRGLPVRTCRILLGKSSTLTLSTSADSSADTGSSIFLLLRVVTIATARRFRAFYASRTRAKSVMLEGSFPRPMCFFFREQQFWFAERLVQQMSPPATVPAVVGTETSAARGAHALERGHTIASNTSKSTGV